MKNNKLFVRGKNYLFFLNFCVKRKKNFPIINSIFNYLKCLF